MCGANRGGTTALYRALIEHPLVASPLHKSVAYFDLHYTEGPVVPRPFPGASDRPPNRTSAGVSPLAMEASGYYLDHPRQSPRRRGPPCQGHRDAA